jgi:hypothetical protein
MSKMDNLRAMREARYERAAARAGKPATPVASPSRARQAPAAQAGPTSTDLPEPGSEAALCGHRAISGRTCTREAGHAAKSHRYG